ncbi:hypothetical protein ACV1MZ_000051 [Klebsiella variicola]
MTSKLTRERLEKIKSWRETYGAGSNVMLPAEEAEELACLALAAMDSEPAAPVAEIVSIYGDPEAFGEREIRPLVGIQQMPYGTKLYLHAQPVVEIEPMAEVLSNRPGNDTSTIDRALPVGTQLYRHAQPAPVVPEKCPAEIRDLISSHTDALFNDDDAQEIWNACRSSMLQASPVCACPSGDGSLRWPCPVHPGNSPAIPDSARDALEKALAAMEFMGDTLNNLDAVCTEDVELVAPSFDAVRSVLAAALQEGK